MKGTRFDFIVAALSALACLGALLHLPVWALFIGWAWYLALGSKPQVIREAGLTCVLSALLAVLAVVMSDWLQSYCSPLAASMLAVFVTIYMLMFMLKVPGIKYPLVAFNAFSCIFAGYYLQAFPVQADYGWSLVYAFIWIVGANILGLFVGWLSIALTQVHQPEPQAETE